MCIQSDPGNSYSGQDGDCAGLQQSWLPAAAVHKGRWTGAGKNERLEARAAAAADWTPSQVQFLAPRQAVSSLSHGLSPVAPSGTGSARLPLTLGSFPGLPSPRVTAGRQCTLHIASDVLHHVQR